MSVASLIQGKFWLICKDMHIYVRGALVCQDPKAELGLMLLRPRLCSMKDQHGCCSMCLPFGYCTCLCACMPSKVFSALFCPVECSELIGSRPLPLVLIKKAKQGEKKSHPTPLFPSVLLRSRSIHLHLRVGPLALLQPPQMGRFVAG